MKLLLLSAVCHKILDHLPVHKRFAAEKVDFEIAARSAVFHEKIQSALSDFVGHKRTLAVILALRCKTVFAVEIAGVRNVKAHCFEHRIALCQNIDVRFECVFREKFALFFELFNVVYALQNVCLAHALVFILFANIFGNLLCARMLVRVDNVVRHVVHAVYASACGVKHDVVSVEFERMNHIV